MQSIRSKITIQGTLRAELVPKLPLIPCPRFHLSYVDAQDFHLQATHQTTHLNSISTVLQLKKKTKRCHMALLLSSTRIKFKQGGDLHK